MRDWRGLLALALVLVAACGGGGDDDGGGDGAAAATGATSTVAGEGGDAAGGPAGTATSAPGGAAATTSAPAGPTTTAPAAPPATGGPPGSAAPFFLRPSPAASIVVEVSANDGADPDGGTLDHVMATLAEVSGKRVEAGAGGALPVRDTWSADDLRAAADAAAFATQGDRAVLRLLFVHGRFDESDSVLGVAVRGDVAAVFVDAVHESASPLVGSGAIETAATMHEVGHLLGLVDLHLKTGRADPDHPGHSTNEGSVMFWAVESTLVTDLLAGGPPRDFDDDDRADLATIRAGG